MAQNVTLQTIIDLIRTTGQIRSNYANDSVLTTHINRSVPGFQDFIRSLDPDYYVKSTTISVSSGDGSYDLPSDFIAPIGVWMADGNYQVALRRISQKDLLALEGTTVGKTNTMYLVLGSALRLFPEPTFSATITLQYEYTLTPFSALTDTLECINGYEMWLVYDVCARINTDRRLFDMVQMHKQDKLIIEDRMRRVVTPRDKMNPSRKGPLSIINQRNYYDDDDNWS